MLEKRRIRENLKYVDNTKYCIDCRVKAALRNFIVRKQKSSYLEKHLKWTIKDLILHLEKYFEKGMTWENFGKWHIDHSVAKVKFNYSFLTDKNFSKCWALCNLKPMWAKDNIKKGCK